MFQFHRCPVIDIRLSEVWGVAILCNALYNDLYWITFSQEKMFRNLNGYRNWDGRFLIWNMNEHCENVLLPKYFLFYVFEIQWKFTPGKVNLTCCISETAYSILCGCMFLIRIAFWIYGTLETTGDCYISREFNLLNVIQNNWYNTWIFCIFNIYVYIR